MSVAVVCSGKARPILRAVRRRLRAGLWYTCSTCSTHHGATHHARCDAVCRPAITGGATECQCKGLALGSNGLDCAPTSLALTQGGNGQMVSPLVMRSFVIVAGGTLRLVLPLYLNSRSSAIFTLVQV